MPTRGLMDVGEVQTIIRALEDGWRGTLEAVRDAEAERTKAVERELADLRARARIVTRALVGMVAVGLIVASLGFAALTSQTDQLDSLVEQQNTSRHVALVDRCRQSNELAQGLRQFVSKVAPNLQSLADRKFRVVPDCEKYARRLLAPSAKARAPLPH